MKLVLATGNPHKVDEIAEILGPRFELVARDPEVEETGTTFEENALLKARAARDLTGAVAVADDSGIVVDALDGRPGIHSARWTHEGDWIPRVLRELATRPERPRTARFVAAAAACHPDGREVVVVGAVEGTISVGPRGAAGFGYDPIFVPAEGDGRTFAEMTAGEKHALSHRGRAFRRLAARDRRMGLSDQPLGSFASATWATAIGSGWVVDSGTPGAPSRMSENWRLPWRTSTATPFWPLDGEKGTSMAWSAPTDALTSVVGPKSVGTAVPELS